MLPYTTRLMESHSFRLGEYVAHMRLVPSLKEFARFLFGERLDDMKALLRSTSRSSQPNA
jgi:hypothetical protein